jgi:glycosyltransferase involved in cell wall biosynthesis
MLLSVVLPALNEAEVLPVTLQTLRGVLEAMDCDWEILVVNDGSRDDTCGILRRAAESDRRIKAIHFSRTFGHQAAITAGIDFAAGDAVVVMDADLQDPPEILPQMLELYRQGYDVVSAQRVSRVGDSVLKRATASLFYWMMNRTVDSRLVREVGDFRLFSRKAVVALRGLREQHRFLRGMVAWLGMKEAILPFDRKQRVAGETKYPLRKMIRFAWTAVSSFSALPLRLSIAAGLALSGAGFLYLIFVLYSALILKDVVPGWASVVVLQCIFSGMTLLALGVIGDYVARIYEEAKGRPLYVVTDTLNIGHPPGDSARPEALLEGGTITAEPYPGAAPEQEIPTASRRHER